MRAVLGAVSLLVVLAIVGLLAVRQLRATGQPVNEQPPPPQSLPLPQQVKADVAKALEQGMAARKEETDK